MRKIKKTIFTLNIGNYAPEVTTYTYPLIRYYADKIGADFHIITERKYPDWPLTYEKMQIYDLGREMGNDWNMYIDSDALINPESLDWTMIMGKDTVLHHARDFANIRWRYNEYFLRDGRNWGVGNWFMLASDWCLDIWRPLDIPFEEAIKNIFPTIDERNNCVTNHHLIDDYTTSYNLARFGIKAKIMKDVTEGLQFEGGFFYHLYNVTELEKLHGGRVKVEGKWKDVPGIIEVVKERWKVPEYIQNFGR